MSIRRWCWRVLVLVSFAAIAAPRVAYGSSEATALPELEVFTRAGCPHCAAAERFLEHLQKEQPALRIIVRRIDRDPDALRRLKELAEQSGAPVTGVPAFQAGGRLLIGFISEEASGSQIRGLLENGAGTAPQVGSACTADSAEPCAGSEAIDRIVLPFFGSVAVGDIGLPFFTIAVGLLDGFNPCAMWVLLFLLSLLVNVHDRAKMLLIAGTFIVASGLAYFAFMAAWLNVFVLIGFSAPARIGLGAIATAIGLVNVKDFFAWRRGISLTIPDSAKPQIYARARRILQAENLGGAMASVIVLAILVNTIELLCTAGFPAVYAHVLAMRELRWSQYYAYLVLYNVAYMLDDGLMVMVAVLTMSRFKLQERGGRWLKLVSGAVLLALGLTLLVRPDWLAFGAW